MNIMEFIKGLHKESKTPDHEKHGNQKRLNVFHY